MLMETQFGQSMRRPIPLAGRIGEVRQQPRQDRGRNALDWGSVIRIPLHRSGTRPKPTPLVRQLGEDRLDRKKIPQPIRPPRSDEVSAPNEDQAGLKAFARG
jgi:hypothetical protein